MRIGVLALQGDFAAHLSAVEGVGAKGRPVRRVRELAEVDALVIPGGESTALLNLMGDEPWFEALRVFHKQGAPILGTCAGAILLAKQVLPEQPSLGLRDITIERNAYGRQVESFEAPLSGTLGPGAGVFIRAPRILRLGPGVQSLASQGRDPVLVREGNILAATFHPELTGDGRVHALLLGAGIAA